MTQENLENVLHHPSSGILFKLFSIYLSVLRQENGDLSQFWMSYIDMVEIVLGLIRASREGNWLLHIAMIRGMIPWCFAYDHQHYARYLPVYYADITRLSVEHPDVYDHYIHGGFAVQLGSSNTFGKIPLDQTIEETVNKDTKTPGGTKGFSLNVGAVTRYYLTAEFRSTCMRKLREMVKICTPGVTHVDLEPSRIKRDEKDVQTITELLEENWINPFSGSPDLAVLSTGSVAPPEIRNDILHAEEIGEAAYTSFRKDRLEAKVPSSSFYDRLPKQHLKTFSDLMKSKKSSTSNREVVLKADHKLFGHLVLVASTRNLDMAKVLCHPLGPLPWSLANCDGSMKKTNKAVLARNLEKRVQPVEEIPQPFACIVDGMAQVHKVHGENKTFGNVADSVFMSILQTCGACNRIDVVFDVYKQVSIKNQERENRSPGIEMKLNSITSGQKIYKWKAILGNSSSKASLVRFFFEEWKKPFYRDKLEPGKKVMHITCETQCIQVTKDGVQECTDLST